MRLTLRTLVAWLDDTLSPNEVRTIGQQVSESPFAQELVERVNRVTRQRRLAAPLTTGPDSTDPNVVSAYLDNELSPDQVAEFEKKCLTSDVHLAEVASVHQILSLIGHKAKVPADAKARMYRLVKGREASPQAQPPARERKPSPAPEPEPAAPSIGVWHPSAASPGRSMLERFGPFAVVFGLIAVLGWTAAQSLRNEPAPVVVKNEPKPVVEPVAPAPVAPRPAPEIPKAIEVAEAPPAMPAEPAEDGTVATFDEIQGVVLRFVPESASWERLAAKEPIKAKTRLLNLAPFRNTLKFPKGDVDLVESTEVVVDQPEAEQAGRLDLHRGMLALRSSATPAPFAIGLDGQVVSIRPSGGADIGVDRLPTLRPGQAEPSAGKLRIYIPSGEVVLRSGEAEERISGPGGMAFLASGKFDERSHQPAPTWVADPSPTSFAKEIGDQFVAYFRADRPILANLVEAMDDSQKDVKRMAVQALAGIGDLESVVAVLEGEADASSHRAAVDALRTGLAQGGEPAKAVRESLNRQYGEEWGVVTERLLVGYPAESARDEAIMSQLVGYLGAAPGRGTRSLALDNLCELTHRDSMEYDPSQPEGKGLKAWQDFLKKEFSSSSRNPSGPRSERRPDASIRARTGAGA
ncbi:hypothetical protein TA3x_003441 [Tundrisphaera sp. TA3]|uniref:hypothetical protein n=1 Tax=Tundrisphaera sp. TA3 TaxID=3435775 RepID=UPI003EC07A26